MLLCGDSGAYTSLGSSEIDLASYISIDVGRRDTRGLGGASVNNGFIKFGSRIGHLLAPVVRKKGGLRAQMSINRKPNLALEGMMDEIKF